jgi:putative DNA primase/helicase
MNEHPAVTFARAVWHPDDRVELRRITPAPPGQGERKNKPRQSFMQASEVSNPKVLAMLAKENAAGANIYAVINPLRMDDGSDDQVLLARSLFVDFDGGVTPEQAKEKIRAAGLPEPSLVVFSGHGSHCYWLLIQALTDMAVWRGIQTALIALLGSDKVIKNPSRVMRLPGFMNCKELPHVEATLVEVHADRRYALDQFPSPAEPEATKTPPSVAARVAAMGSGPGAASGGAGGLSRATLLFLHLGASEGERNTALFTAACDYHGCGLPQDQADRELGEAARRSGLGDAEIKCAINSAYSKARSPARPPTASVSGGGSGVPPSGGSGGPPEGGNEDCWPEPKPLPDALPPVMAFDPALLPEALRPWIVDIADRVQCPIDFPAVAVMIAVSALVGRKLGIRPKRHDDWMVVPNLWGAVIGRPGVMKTPAIQEPLKPLKRLEILAKKNFEETLLDAEAAKLVADAQKNATKQQIREALENPEEAFKIARESLGDEPDEPVRKRYIVNDTTVEKLGVLLNENPHGVLVYRDELIGLLKGLDKEGQEGARAFYLESWNGSGRYTYDRIGRGTLDIEAAITSIVGGIQPGPLGQYLRGAAREGVGDDGFVQRFQLGVWPDISKEWVNVDRWPDSEARDLAYHVFDGLDHLDPTLLGADIDKMEPGGIPFVRFSEEAQPVFDAWRARLEARVRSGDLHPALESHLAKFRSLIPSLAVLIHLAEGGRAPVHAGALRKAIAWGRYLYSHAKRIYSQAIHPDVEAARALAKHILARDLKTGFALRDVYRRGWSGLANARDAEGGVDMLVGLDWLLERREPTAGRTSTVYYINPRVYDPPASPKNAPTAPEGTDGTDESPPSGSSVSPPGDETPKPECPGGAEPRVDPPPDLSPGPPDPCHACGKVKWWTCNGAAGTHWTCGSCHEPASGLMDVTWWHGNLEGRP